MNLKKKFKEFHRFCEDLFKDFVKIVLRSFMDFFRAIQSLKCRLFKNGYFKDIRMNGMDYVKIIFKNLFKIFFFTIIQSLYFELLKDIGAIYLKVFKRNLLQK